MSASSFAGSKPQVSPSSRHRATTASCATGSRSGKPTGCPSCCRSPPTRSGGAEPRSSTYESSASTSSTPEPGSGSGATIREWRRLSSPLGVRTYTSTCGEHELTGEEARRRLDDVGPNVLRRHGALLESARPPVPQLPTSCFCSGDGCLGGGRRDDGGRDHSDDRRRGTVCGFSAS